MPPETGTSAARVLRVLEIVATHQPIGVRAAAKLLEEDKSAVHRAMRTLVAQGWIVATDERIPRWRIGPHFMTLANTAQAGFDLRHRSRPALQRLRDRCLETVVLIVLDGNRLIVAEVFESLEALRWVPPVGTQAEPHRTAGGRAIIPFFPPDRQLEILGGPIDADLEAIYEATRARGYSISDRETSQFSTSIGAPVFGDDGLPCAVVTIIGPSERIWSTGLEKLGEMAKATAALLSTGTGSAR